MDLRHLRYFAAVADSGGITRAAERLNISQPALSRQIRDLELELGLSLFDRRAGRVVLTGEGEDLLTRSREILRGARSLHDRAQALRGGEAGIIRIGVAPLTLESLLPPFLVEYLPHHPKIDVRLTEDNPGELWEQLDLGELDLAISFPGHAGLGSRLLFPVCAVALMVRDHRLGGSTTVDVGELAQEQLLLPVARYLTRQWFDAACQRDHLRPNIVLESSVPHALIALAKVGYGIAIVPSHTPIDQRALRAVPITRGAQVLGAWAGIAWNPHRFRPAYMGNFVEELVKYASRAFPGRGLVGKRIMRSIPSS